jgi:hypothetical protein
MTHKFKCNFFIGINIIIYFILFIFFLPIISIFTVIYYFIFKKLIIWPWQFLVFISHKIKLWKIINYFNFYFTKNVTNSYNYNNLLYKSNNSFLKFKPWFLAWANKPESLYLWIILNLYYICNTNKFSIINVIKIIVSKNPKSSLLLADFFLNIEVNPYLASKIYEFAIIQEPQNIALQIKNALLVSPIELSPLTLKYRRKNILKNSSNIIKKIIDKKVFNIFAKNDPTETGLELVHASSKFVTYFLMGQAEHDDLPLKKATALLFATAYPNLSWRPQKFNRPQKKLSLGFIFDALKHDVVLYCWGPLLSTLRQQGFYLTLFRREYLYTHFNEADHLFDKICVYQTNDWKKTRSIIFSENLDIFYNPNLGESLLATLIAFSRLAPIQVMDAGYTTTSGLPDIDYYIANECFLPDNADSLFSEELIRLPGIPELFWNRPTGPLESVTRSDFGLPTNKKLYFCIQDPRKIHPEFDSTLARILHLDKDGVIVLSSSGQSGVDRYFLQRLSFNCPPERLFFLPHFGGYRPRYLSALALQDAGLSAWKFCGGTTFSDHNSLNLPLITREAQSYAGRFVSGTYRYLNISELVADKSETQADLAIKMAHDINFKNKIKSKLALGLYSLQNNKKSYNNGLEFLSFKLKELIFNKRNSL